MVAGAILYWGISVQLNATSAAHGFRLSTIGVILMIAGAIGFVASSIVFASSRRVAKLPAKTTSREVVDAQGHTTTMHEEVR